MRNARRSVLLTMLWIWDPRLSGSRFYALVSPILRFSNDRTRRMTRTASLVLALFVASALVSSAEAQKVVVNEVLASNAATLADPDFANFGDWIELHNATDAAVDLSGYTITDDLSRPDKWALPTGTTIAPRGFLLVWADDEDTGPPSATALHANFKLSAGGESVGLFDASGAVVDTLTFGEQTTDISYGRLPGGADTWAFFSTPTPGAANASDGSLPPPDAPKIALATGFYSRSVAVAIQAEAGATIRYTLDGSPPTQASTAYSSALTFDSTTVLRAAAFATGQPPSDIVTRTFFIDEASTLPVISLVSDPEGFFSDTSGIYVEGTNGIAGRCRTVPVNWNQDWEREAQFSFFEPDGAGGFELILDHGAGVQIFGGCSRIYPQKSLSLHARSSYGASDFAHRFFADLDIDSFDDLVLRTSAQDWWRTMFRDGMTQTLTRHMDLDGQAFRPTVVFLNGAYWGIHNLREKLNEDYVAGHYNVKDEDVEIIENTLRGTSEHYDQVLDLLDAGPLTDDRFAQLEALIDVEQFLNYQIAQIYAANGDWPGNNLKLWRSTTEGGGWRWMMYDTDFSFGGNSRGKFDTNTLAFASAAQREGTLPNPQWATYLFRKLLERDAFRHTFVQRMAAHIGTTFEPERVVALIDSLKGNIAPEMPRHTTRWTQSASFGSSWESQIEIMRDFAHRRPGFMRSFITQQFADVNSSVLLTLDATEGGRVFAEAVELPRAADGSPFAQPFFRDVPLRLAAIPDDGYVFAGWSGQTESSSDSISVVLMGTSSLTATFAIATASPSGERARQTRLSSARPNPTSHTATLTAEMAQSGPMSVRVYDLLGREIAVLADGPASSGPHALTFDASTLPNGVYVVVMIADAVRATQRVVVAR